MPFESITRLSESAPIINTTMDRKTVGFKFIVAGAMHGVVRFRISVVLSFQSVRSQKGPPDGMVKYLK